MSREQTLEFQSRWMRPAGIAAILGAALLVVSAIVGSVGSAEDTAEQLLLYQDHSGRLFLASVISALGLLTLAIPLLFLLRSAQFRSERVRPFVGVVVVFGAFLLAIQGTLFSIGLKDASDQYVAGVGRVEAQARQDAETPPPAKGDRTTTTATTATATATTATPAKSVDEQVADARDNFAEDEVNDSSTVQVARLIGLLGAVALIAGSIYTLVWAMRTGLLTRFMATIGMVFIAVLILIPGLGPIGLILWFSVLGLMLAGRWIRPLPPAWAAGEAIAWPRPGEDLGPPPEERAADTVEGSGREVSEAPLAEDGEPDQPPEPRYGETQGQRRKKRKRRN
jgi:hypothetical protein